MAPADHPTTPPGDGTTAAGPAPELPGAAHRAVAVAVVTPQGTRLSGRGVADDAEFEIGSVTKGLTGLLYADAVDRGLVTAKTTLGDLLPLGHAPAAAVTLGALATHRSGLPKLAAAAHPYRATWELLRHGTNPYGETLAELLDQTRPQRLRRARPRYSNLGFCLLGHAVAAAAGTTYATLLDDRLVRPLDLAGVSVPAAAADLGPRALVGTSRLGRKAEAWTGEGIGPAGGVRAPIGAMAALVAALLAGRAPGLTALDQVADFGWGTGIGAGWLVANSRTGVVTWHNGGTGGFRSFVGLDRTAGVGVVVLTATARSVDGYGLALLGRARDAAEAPAAGTDSADGVARADG